jgi:hypothetical protein
VKCVFAINFITGFPDLLPVFQKLYEKGLKAGGARSVVKLDGRL